MERGCFAIFDDARCRGADLKVGVDLLINRSGI